MFYAGRFQRVSLEAAPNVLIECWRLGTGCDINGIEQQL